MQLTVKSLLVLFFLASCSTTEDTRYRDTTKLELPPALRADAQVIPKGRHDDSALPDKEDNKGMGDSVYMTAAEPPVLMIKQAFDIGWNTLESALKQSEIEIKDRDLDKGLYYVIFDPDQYVPENDTVADRLGSLFTNDYSQTIYVLTVTADGDETQINAAKASKADQGSLSDPDDDHEENDEKTDGAEKLLLFLFKTLRDDLIEK